MAQEFTLGGSIAYQDDEGTDILEQVSDLVDSITTKKFTKAKIAVGTSEEAIPLGEVSSLGWAFIRNLDDTNYLEIRSATGSGNDIIKIKAGKFALFHFGSDVSAPYAIANTAPVQMEYIIWAA